MIDATSDWTLERAKRSARFLAVFVSAVVASFFLSYFSLGYSPVVMFKSYGNEYLQLLLVALNGSGEYLAHFLFGVLLGVVLCDCNAWLLSIAFASALVYMRVCLSVIVSLGRCSDVPFQILIFQIPLVFVVCIAAVISGRKIRQAARRIRPRDAAE